MTNSLILACSATKLDDPRPLMAIARYDGPAWRTLRAHMTCDILPPFALSAEHGLISAYEEIVNYDRQMTLERARALVDPVADRLEALALAGELGDSTLVFGGGVYRDLIEQARALATLALGYELPMSFTTGGIGDQLGQLKAFLVGEPVR